MQRYFKEDDFSERFFASGAVGKEIYLSSNVRLSKQTNLLYNKTSMY